MKRTCDVCGCEADDYWMVPYNTGRGVKWFCWECWKTSQREANLSDRHRQQKLYKIKKSKERNR